MTPTFSDLGFSLVAAFLFAVGLAVLLLVTEGVVLVLSWFGIQDTPGASVTHTRTKS